MTTPRDRDVLSRTLRDLRTDAGLTLAQVAERLDVNMRTISRYERGDIVPSVAVIEQLCAALGAKPAQRRQLVALAQDVREGTETRLVFLRRGSGGARRMQDRIARADAQSRHVGSFANQLVTGMLQTPEYMRAVFRSAGVGEADTESAARGRQARLAQALESTDREYTQLVTEGALAWHAGGPDLMVAQVEHIAALATQGPPHFRVGIIPRSRPSELFPMGSFDLYDARAVVVGTDVATAWMTNPRDVGVYHRLFGQLCELADFGEAAVPTLDRIANEYRSLA